MSSKSKRKHATVNLIRKQWFLATLMLVLLVGILFGQPLRSLLEVPSLKWTIVAITMFLMAWPFSFGDITQTLARPQAPLLASAINAIAMPILLWPFLWWFDPEISAGMVVVFASPCTLASAAVWTRRAGGDDRVAIMVTLITNLLCFVIAPFWVWLQTGFGAPADGTSSESAVDFGDTVWKLLMFVVLPIGVAQAVRLQGRSAIWATKNKRRLSIGSQIGILSIVFLGAIQTGVRLRSDETSLPFAQLVVAVAILLALHVLVLLAAVRIARACGFERQVQIAVGIAGSQKTLMVGLSIAVSLQVTILPLIAFHSLQLIVDTLVVDRLRVNGLPTNAPQVYDSASPSGERATSRS